MTSRLGIDTPDHRGRTGLDRAGRGLDRNPDVVIRDVELTSQGWHVLRRTTFDYRRRDGRWRRSWADRRGGSAVATSLACAAGHRLARAAAGGGPRTRRGEGEAAGARCTARR